MTSLLNFGGKGTARGILYLIWNVFKSLLKRKLNAGCCFFLFFCYLIYILQQFSVLGQWFWSRYSGDISFFFFFYLLPQTTGLLAQEVLVRQSSI
jgi:hypothetical protein